jgi:DNA-directed RNA polymerase subunit RPC12/RpoP
VEVLVACSRCGLAFETRATTNTRCRRCRHVVNVRAVNQRRQPDVSCADGGRAITLDSAMVALPLLGVALVGVGAWLLWAGWCSRDDEDHAADSMHRRRRIALGGSIAAGGIALVWWAWR